MVLTDSGGLQKEAYWLSVPCITLREETEWVETTATGWNVLAGTAADKIVNVVKEFSPPSNHPGLYGQPGVAKSCVMLLESKAGGSGVESGRPLRLELKPGVQSKAPCPCLTRSGAP